MMYEIREFDGNVREEWRPVTNSELSLIAYSADFDEWEFIPLLEKETRDGDIFRLVLNDFFIEDDGAAYESGVEIRRRNV